MNHKRNRKCIIYKRGFTLIELLVGLMVFSLAVGVAINLFAAALRAQRKSIAIQNVQDNGRYLISFIAKEIRMSRIVSADGETLILNIEHPTNGNITYTFTGAPNWQILRTDADSSGSINSSEVNVDGRFSIAVRAVGDNIQPRVTIIMKITNKGVKVEEQSEIDLQTTFSQRRLD